MCNSPLQVQGRRAQSVGEDFPLRIEVGERSTFLHVRHHGRVPHPETAVDPTTTTSIGQHSEESVLVDVVLALIQAFSRGFIGGTKTIIRLAAQTYESVSAPLNFEQAGCSFIEGLACEATRFCGRPRASSETSLDVVVFVLVTTFGRQPLRPVPEVVFAVLGCDEIVNAVAGQRNIGGVRVHFTVLVEWSLDVSTIETAHSISTNERSSDIIKIR